MARKVVTGVNLWFEARLNKNPASAGGPTRVAEQWLQPAYDP